MLLIIFKMIYTPHILPEFKGWSEFASIMFHAILSYIRQCHDEATLVIREQGQNALI